MNVNTRTHPNHAVFAQVRDCTICMETFWRAQERLAKLDRESVGYGLDHDAYLRDSAVTGVR